MMSEFIPVVIFYESSLPLCILSTWQPELINKVGWYCIFIERLTFWKDVYDCPIWYSGTGRVRYEVFKGILQKTAAKNFAKFTGIHLFCRLQAATLSKYSETDVFLWTLRNFTQQLL